MKTIETLAPSNRAQVLLVDDNTLDAHLGQITLIQAGFQVAVAASLLEGEQLAMALLGLDEPFAPPFILLDLKLPDLSNPQLEGAILAAALRLRIQQQLIRSTWIIGITNDLSVCPEDAKYAGLNHVLPKPLLPSHAQWFQSLVGQPIPTLPVPTDTGKRLYQAKAEEMLAVVRRARQPPVWTEADVQLVLSALTPYAHLHDPERGAALVLALGGQHNGRAWLRQIATTLKQPYRDLLVKLVEQHQPQALQHQLNFDRSWIHRCLAALPRVISAQLANHQPYLQ